MILFFNQPLKIESEAGNVETKNNGILKVSYPVSKVLEAGEYYYLHVLKSVPSNSSQCLFSLFTDGHGNRPFFSYYAQSPAGENYEEVYYSYSFIFDSKHTLQISRSNPITLPLNLNSSILLYKRKE